MSNIINTRSPFYYKDSGSGVASIKFEIKIYTGDQTPAPSTIQYTIIKNTTTPTSGNPYAIIEISELIRDYLYTDYYTEAVDAVWVHIAPTKYDGADGTGSVVGTTGSDYYLALDGFGYFEEGINPRQSIDPSDESFTPMLLQDNLTMYFIKGEEIKLPIFAETEPTITFSFSGGSDVEWQTLDEFWESYEATWNSSLDDVTIIDDGNSNQKIQYVGIFPTDGIETGDTATITSTVVGQPQTQIVTFKEICEPKFTPVRVIFYNKYGALQDIWASKKWMQNLNQTSQKYNTNIIDIDDLTYSTYKHSQKRFDITGQEGIVVNTTYLDESINEPVKQLLMSEQVWLEIGDETYPVTLTTSSIKEKTSVNDRLVQYTFDFNYANTKIQNVR